VVVSVPLDVFAVVRAQFPESMRLDVVTLGARTRLGAVSVRQ
jgi:hypothetical protein